MDNKEVNTVAPSTDDWDLNPATPATTTAPVEPEPVEEGWGQEQITDQPADNTDTDAADEDQQDEITVSFLDNIDKQGVAESIFFGTDFDESWQDFVLMIAPYKQDEIIALIEKLNPEHERYDDKFFNELFKDRPEEQVHNFYRNMSLAVNYVLPGKGLDKFVADTGAKFAQGVEYKGKYKTPSRASSSFAERKESARMLSGNDALARYRQMTDKGEYQDIFLPLTGCHIRLGIAGDDEHIILNETIGKEIAVIGRKTTGAVYSNTNVMIERAVVDFILERMKRNSLNLDKEKFKERLAAPDVDLLLIAYAAGRFTRGYPLRVICNAEDACEHTEEHAIDIGKLIHYANGRLTETQRALAFTAPGKIKDGDVEYYQREHRWHQFKTATLKSGLIVHFRVPSYADKEKGGLDWISGLENVAAMALDNTYNAQQRETFIKSQAAATSLYQYLPWIDKIEFPNGNSEGDYAEGEAMQKVLRDINQEATERDELFDKVNDFINECLVAVVGYPRWTCPECQGLQPEVSSVIPGIWPINPLHVFFTLITNALKRNLRGADIS